MMSLFEAPMISALGWALVHALWQCAMVAVGAWVGLRVLRHKGAQARYLTGCVALGVMLALPVATFFWLWEVPTGVQISGFTADATVITVGSIPGSQGGSLRPVLPWLILAWTAGVCGMTVRLGGGWLWIQRLRWVQTEPAEANWQESLVRLAHRLGLRRSLRLVRSHALEVPMVLGWLRPVILVPAAIFSAMEPRALEAILAHELAHIRRHDYFLNLLQSAVEVLLFFHPAVWWLSAQVRAERENCCDDIAISLCGDPLFYARALAALEDLRPALTPNPSLALAATGGTLMNRIRRILVPTLPPSPAARTGLLAALAVSVLGAASTLGLRPQDAPKPAEAAQEIKEAKKTVTVVVDADAKAPQKLKIEMKGKLKIQPETVPPVALEEGARLEIEGKDGEQLRSYLAERGPGGEKRVWTLEGKEQVPDAQAEAWLKKSLEAAQKFTFRWEGKEGPGRDKSFFWKQLEGADDKVLQEKAKLLEEKAKLLAEKRVAKGTSEAEVARLQEEVSRQAKEVAAQARKLAASRGQLAREQIRVMVAESKAQRDAAKDVREHIREEMREHVTVKGSGKEGDPMTRFLENGEPGTIHLDVEAEEGGNHVIVKRQDFEGPEGGDVMILRGQPGDPKAEIEALKKAIQRMQGRLEKLQKEAEAPAK